MRAKIVRFFLATLLVSLIGFPVLADDKPPATTSDPYDLLHALIYVLKTRHINRATVDWPSVEARAFAMVPNAKTYKDTGPAIQFVLAAVHERHTLLISPERYRMMSTGQSSNPAMVAAFLTLPAEKELAGGIGYIALPGHNGSVADDRAYALSVRDALRRFHAAGICRFIVDLRHNAGGDMYPMIAAVKSLLGPQPYGYWDVGDTLKPWLDPDKIAHFDGTPGADYGPLPPDDARHPVAVLVDRHTASSGEFTAIAFEGRHNTQFFGEPSAGYVTGNELTPLPDGWYIALTTSRGTDRNRRPFNVAVVPDVETPTGDATDAAAIAWLKRQRCR
jgi:C-terminal processing protease CtpA/Prc